MWPRFRAPCEQPATQSERLSVLIDAQSNDKAGTKLADHVGGCESCAAVLADLRLQRAALARFGDAPDAAPTDVGFHRLISTLRAERRVRRLPTWFALAATATAVVLIAGVGVRQLQVARQRRVTDEEIVAGADAAYRRAEREYGVALSLLEERVRAGKPDARVEEGARALATARERAAALVAEDHADPEREALLRDAFRAEVRYYEDALLRGNAEVAP